MGNNWLHDGYLNLDITAETDGVKIIIFIILSISLLFQCAIALTAWNKMRHNPVDSHVKFCFYLGVVSSFIVNILLIINYCGWSDNSADFVSVIKFIELTFYNVFVCSLLLTFIVRLYSAFLLSAYRISQGLIVFFVLILIAELVVGIAGYALIVFSTNLIVTGFYMVFFCFLLHLIGCLLAVHFFVFNLAQITKGMMTSPKHPKGNADILTEQQMKLSNLSSKYTMLFGIAIGSSILNMVMMNAFHYAIRGPFISCDCSVNLWCLYLHFVFAEKQYIRSFGLKRTTLMIQEHSQKLSTQKSKVEIVTNIQPMPDADIADVSRQDVTNTNSAE